MLLLFHEFSLTKHELFCLLSGQLFALAQVSKVRVFKDARLLAGCALVSGGGCLARERASFDASFFVEF